MIEARAPTRAWCAPPSPARWEATNESWMLLKDVLASRSRGRTGHARSHPAAGHAVRGAMEGTMLRNDIFNFARIGTHLERADNTARILDVKYHVLLPSLAWVGSRLDNAQWEMVLRSVAGERAFRWLNAGALDPKGIAEFLILDGRFPRSLAYCYAKLTSNMEWLCQDYEAETAAFLMQRAACHKLRATSIEAIFETGLHEFITDFLVTNRQIADAIAADYRFAE
jgi:uncharacterized alpha-E superfamily protein